MLMVKWLMILDSGRFFEVWDMEKARVSRDRRVDRVSREIRRARVRAWGVERKVSSWKYWRELRVRVMGGVDQRKGNLGWIAKSSSWNVSIRMRILYAKGEMFMFSCSW